MLSILSKGLDRNRGNNKKETETHKSNGEKLLESIYIGGGTPSRLSIHELSRLLIKVREHLTCAKNVEITFEMNPEDVSKEYLKTQQDLNKRREWS